MSYNYHGRRICKFSIPGGFIFTWSGQWVGHRYYGDEKGTVRQIKNAQPKAFLDNGGCIISYDGSSEKIFWNKSGVAAGEVIAKIEGDEWTGDKAQVDGLSFSE